MVIKKTLPFSNRKPTKGQKDLIAVSDSLEKQKIVCSVKYLSVCQPTSRPMSLIGTFRQNVWARIRDHLLFAKIVIILFPQIRFPIGLQVSCLKWSSNVWPNTSETMRAWPATIWTKNALMVSMFSIIFGYILYLLTIIMLRLRQVSALNFVRNFHVFF